MIRNISTTKLIAPPLSVPNPLIRKSNARACCLAVAAAVLFAFPVAQGIGAVSPKPIPEFQVNRAAKGNMMAAPRPTVQRVPVQTIQNPAKPVREQSDQRTIMDGCEPAFSPVTVPTMAHIAGRCVG